ncbi:hypothetical protein GPALN_011347 [Globodera pallida]|nr:hypothetical protein GPALN_011347 [Globodera pallida]
MGASESVPIPGGGSEGYHVLRVQENSPGQMAGLEPFFDFIVAIGNTRLDKDNDSLKENLKQNIDKPLELTVYNSKTQTVRETQIVPSQNWGGQGVLGVSIRFCSFEGANQNVWHIISVTPNSPAELAGLQSNTDYVLGAESVLQQADDLIAFVQANLGKPLKLYVYNVDSDSVREVTLTPNASWGGDGCLGCDIGYGYLHRIPISIDRSKPSSEVSPMLSPHSHHIDPQEMSQQSPSLPPLQTGIPNVDHLINASQFACPTATDVKRFPDPSEFALPPQSVNGISSPSVSSFDAPLSSPPHSQQPTLPPPPAPINVTAFPQQQHQQRQDNVQSVPSPVNAIGFEPSGLPIGQQTSRRANDGMSPLVQTDQRFPSSTVQPPASSTPSVLPMEQQHHHSSQLGSPLAPSSMVHEHNQLQQQPPQQTPPPIHSSTYQPYLAYGAPPPLSYQSAQQQQFQPMNQPSSAPFMFPSQQPQFGQHYHAPHQPPSFYAYPTQQQQNLPSCSVPPSIGGFGMASPPSLGQRGGPSFPPPQYQQFGGGQAVQQQPPAAAPISFPMPPLSSLGISNLVVPLPQTVASTTPSAASGEQQPTVVQGSEQQQHQQVPPPSFLPPSQPFFG